jgi:hypothetical protein
MTSSILNTMGVTQMFEINATGSGNFLKKLNRSGRIQSLPKKEKRTHTSHR